MVTHERIHIIERTIWSSRNTASPRKSSTTCCASGSLIESRPLWITRCCRFSGCAWSCAVSVKLLISLRSMAGTSCSQPSPKVRIRLPVMFKQRGRPFRVFRSGDESSHVWYYHLRPHNWAISRHSGGICDASISATPAKSSTASCKPGDWLNKNKQFALPNFEQEVALYYWRRQTK